MRILDCGCTAVITQDEGWRAGKRIPLKANADKALEGCPDVHIIGARGSGQPSGYGEQVAPVVEALVAGISATGRSVTDEPLDYPAISISDSFGVFFRTSRYPMIGCRAGCLG